MDQPTFDLLAESGKLVVTAAVAFGGLKAALNGMKADVAEIKGTVNKISEKVDFHGERIAVLEDRGDRPRPKAVP